ncbi:MAG: hypothetical protein AB8B93_06970 [Pseudomonadales bacterium]
MSWTTVAGASGPQWQVNQDGLYLTARASARAALARRYTREKRSGEGWFDGPVLTEVITDWGKVNRQTDAAAATLYRTLAEEIMNHPANCARNLAAMVAETRSNQNHLRNLQQRIVRDNMRNVSSRVNDWENATAVTRFVRDTAWTTLVVLSAIPSGGATAALTSGVRVSALAAGSLGRGQATYQDTGNIGAAVVSASGSFVTGAIGLPPGGGTVLSGGQTAILLGIQSASAGGFAGIQGLAEGREAETAVQQAISAAGFNLLGGLASGAPAVSNASLPVQLSVLVPIDTAGNAANSWIGDRGRRASTPRTRGRVTHGGAPVSASGDEEHIRSTVLRRGQTPGRR